MRRQTRFISRLLSARRYSLFLEEPARLIEQGEAVEAEFIESMKKRVETGCEVSDEEVKLFAPKEIASKMNQYPGIGLSILEGKEICSCKEKYSPSGKGSESVQQ